MVRARLIHKIPVFLHKGDRASTLAVDENLQEPVGEMYRASTATRLYAQIHDVQTDRPEPGEGGISESSDGYLLFETSHLRDMLFDVERGDLIVQIGEGLDAYEVRYFITTIKKLGHYNNNSTSGPTIIRAYYADRHPSQTR